MSSPALRSIVLYVSCFAVLGCTQAAPVADGASTDPGTTMGSDTLVADGETELPPLDGDYYPLVDGATWTYRHTSSTNGVWDEVVTMRQVEHEGRTAYQSEDNEDSNMESSLSVLVREGTTVLRVHKDVTLAGVPSYSVDYDPGFLRVDEAWLEGDSVEWAYDRTEHDTMGTPLGTVTRNMVFTVESTSAEVTVPAGTFECLQVTRQRVDNGETKRYWFARGVGKVKHETVGSGSSEELVEYSIP